jgi:predicted nucleic acid-binding protein
MIVVSNTSPIINLACIGQLDLLRQIYGQITIPDAVFTEITVNGIGQPGAEDVPRLPWIVRHRVIQQPLIQVLRLELDAGEAETLAGALELKADLVLLDERRAREAAQRLGLRFIGLLGVLIEARRQQRLSQIRPLLDDLRQKAGFWITDALYQRVLAAAGESPKGS